MSESRTSADGGMETSYGFREVPDGEKQGLVNQVFHKVAKRYDIITTSCRWACTAPGRMR